MAFVSLSVKTDSIRCQFQLINALFEDELRGHGWESFLVILYY